MFVKFRPARKLFGQELELSPTPLGLLLVKGDFGAENHKIFFIFAKMLDNLLSS